MSKFLFKLTIFLVVVFSFLLFTISLADGNTDAFYLRFTTPKQNSLILGNSRAAQGIQPAILNSSLKNDYSNLNIYNFSFTASHSPYGPVYYNAINKILDKKTKNGLFILAVDPWSISSQLEEGNDSTKFLENRLCLGTTKFYGVKPNVEYLFESYNNPFALLLVNKISGKKNKMFLNDNGWLEVAVSMKKDDVEKRTQEKVAVYKKDKLPYYKFSSLRLKYLNKTIKMLRNHGDVYLIRLPAEERFYQIENKLLPEFDLLMNTLALENEVPYINLMDTRQEYQYTDGNHIYRNSGKQLTANIAKLITERH